MLPISAKRPALVFDALGNPVRREIVEMLREEPSTVGRLADRLPISRPAVSKHLRVLESAGLVAFEPHGTSNVYQLNPTGFVEAREWLDGFWDNALARFALVAENTDERESND